MEMARTVPSDIAAGAGGLLPARQVGLRQAARLGLYGGLTVVFVASIGMLVAFKDRLIVRQFTLDYVILLAIPLAFGFLAGRPPPQLEGFEQARRSSRSVLAGAVTGAVAAGEVGVFLVLVGNFNVRDQLINISPEMLNRLTFQQGLVKGWLLLTLGGVGLTALGASLNVLDHRLRGALSSALLWVVVFGLLRVVISTVLDKLQFAFVDQLYNVLGSLTIPGAIGVFAVIFAIYAAPKRTVAQLRTSFDELPGQRRKLAVGVMLVALLAVLVIVPQLLSSDLNDALNIAGIFLLMGLGLNIVVGVAGLLDLGYVAFFAVGAYTTASLMAPQSSVTHAPRVSPQLIFWETIPFVILAAAVAGILVATPVLRMRGDYLAIVTLGFGEITRLLVQSTWLTRYFGGALGITNIPSVKIFGVEFLGGHPERFFYLILLFLVVVVYVSYAVQDSRLGRAWMAIREDESVAEAMGVNIVSAKLWAFIIGAVVASFGGALFVVNRASVFPNSFEIIVSITVLAIVIVGGMGSIPGVVLAALVLVALPNVLQEFSSYRYLIYGALLIFMMLKRPEGFIPSRRRAEELREEELLQDAWLRARQAEIGEAQPTAVEGS
jgi:branched-chain amino acid transport system permease protein